MQIRNWIAAAALVLSPVAVFGQAGTPQTVKSWSVLNEATDTRSGDAGCYNSSQITFAKNNLQLVQAATATNCGYTGSQNSPATGTTSQSYKTGGMILSTLNFKPTAGHNIVIEAKAKMGRGWPAIWLLGAGCQATTPYTWDNTFGSGNPTPPPHTCNWAQDSNDSSEIDMAEGGPGPSHYASIGHNIWTGSGAALNGGCSETVSDITANVHVYHLDWSTTAIHMGTDGSNSACSYGAGIPLNPMFILVENRQTSSASTQDNNLPSTMTVQYIQVCDAGSGTTCSTPGVNGGNTIFFDDFTPPPAPTVYFTDLSSGPNTGGENNNGTILTIYGRNFGVTQGTSTVQIGGGNVAAYTQWGGRSKAGTPGAQVETITVAIGAAAATGTVVVNTAGGASNCADTKDSCQFTVRAGNIRCVAVGGSDAATGNFPASCWATIVKAKNSAVAGDIAYVENGVTQAGVDNFNASLSIVGNNCTSAAPCALVAYPGATATIGTAAQLYAIRTPAVGGVKDFWTIAGFNLVGQDALDLVVVTGWRVINNDMTCPQGSGQSACMHTDTTTQYRFYGNYTHNVGDQAASIDKFYHGNYFTTNTNHVWMGWNEVDNNPTGSTTKGGCRAVQFFSTGGSDQFDLHVHDNWLHDSICDGLNFSTVNPDNGTVEAYNNVIYHVGTGPDPTNGNSDYACLVAGGGGVSAVQFFNNTMYDCGGRQAADSGVIFVGRAATMTNNIAQQIAGEIYLTSSSVAASLSGANNIWFGATGAPSQTTNNVTTDPQYRSVVTPDFSIPSASPANGSGTPTHTSIFDFLGLVRPNPPSRGSYEVSSGILVPAPLVSLTPTSLTYVSQTISTSSAAQTVTLTNTGNASLTIASISITGTNAGDYAISSNTCGATLAQAANCAVGVKFTPTALGTRTASLTFTTNAVSSPDNVSLSGTGISSGSPASSLAPSSESFGLVKVTQSAGPLTVTLQNVGSAVMNIGSISITGTNASEFSQTNTCTATLAVNATCTISATFSPVTTGSKSASISVASNTLTSPDTVPLTGTGTAPIASLAPGSVNFFNQFLGTTTSIPQIIVLTNTGTAQMVITSITVTGANAADFGQSSTCGGTLPNGSSCNITVTFTPSVLGTRNAAITIIDDAAGSPHTVGLTGVGVQTISGVGTVTGTGTVLVRP